MKNLNNKDTLRQKCRALRRSFGEEFIIKASTKACERLANSLEFQQARTVLLYFPINNELSPLPLFEIAKKMNKIVAFPACDKESKTLIFRRIERLSCLKPSIFGIMEPDESAETIEPDEQTLCVVPALLFSLEGDRLGYGKGYYDRFLKDFRGISAGFSYSELVCESLPHDSHDIKLDMLITESEVHRFA